ncbi:adhesion G-protein coupled receptor F1 [Biomphalaria glabrata]|nr:adhesion G-protein coupled receptor F1 [Biomphalaria glabrata]
MLQQRRKTSTRRAGFSKERRLQERRKTSTKKADFSEEGRIKQRRKTSTRRTDFSKGGRLQQGGQTSVRRAYFNKEGRLHHIVGECGLRTNQTKDFVSIKNTVGVKLETITQDIRIPEVNQSASKPFDNWIRNSKNGIFLPKDALEDLTDMSRYTIIVIKRGEHNATDYSQMNRSSIMSKPKIVSDVIAVSVGHSVTLKSPVTLTFGISNVTQFYMAPVKVVCVYLEMSLSGSVVWTEKGCFTEKSSDDQIICKCYHLTSFAVLMGSKQLTQHQALTVLTITGCGVSIVSLSITIVVYLYLWKYVKSERSVLLINICVCMLISYLVFLVGIDKTDHQILCQLIAIFLHYSFLCVFFNFLTQSLALYKSIFNKSGRARLEMFLPVTYITPLLIVGATALVNKAEGYGTSNFCWLSVNKGFIWSFLGPVILNCLSTRLS